MAAIEFCVLGPDDHDLVEDAFDSVLRPSFEDTELPSISFVTPETGRMLLVGMQQSRVIAASVRDELAGTDIALLSYFATAPDRRSQGVGAAMMKALRAQWTARATPLVVGEVRDPRRWPSTDTDRSADRLAFYARNGAYLLPAPWIQPGLGGGPREPGMLLITVHGAQLGAVIDTDRVVAWTAAYYTANEGSAPTDEQYLAMIDRFSTTRFEVAPIDNYRSVELLD